MDVTTVNVDELTFRRTFACKFVADHFPAATTPARTLGWHRFLKGRNLLEPSPLNPFANRMAGVLSLGQLPPVQSWVLNDHVGTCRNMSEHVGTLRLLFFGWLNAHYGLCRCRVVVHEPIFCACGKNSIEPPSVWSPDWSCAVAVEPSLSSLEHRKIVLICIRSLTFLT